MHQACLGRVVKMVQQYQSTPNYLRVSYSILLPSWLIKEVVHIREGDMNDNWLVRLIKENTF